MTDSQALVTFRAPFLMRTQRLWLGGSLTTFSQAFLTPVTLALLLLNLAVLVLFDTPKGDQTTFLRGNLMNQSISKALLSMTLASSMTLGLTACDERDVAVGAGLIGIGAGIIAIDKATDNNHRDRDHYRRPPKRDRQCRPSYERKCTSYRDRWGNNKRDCRTVERRNCTGFYSMSMYAKSDAVSEVSPLVEQWAEAYKLSYEGAEKVLSALERSHDGDPKALKELGLNSFDLMAMGKLEMISDEGLTAMSENLDQYVDDTQSMVEAILTEGKAQASDSSSYLWKTCIQSGHWKTPENRSCKSTSWTGCGVDTGATLCIPK